jgi:hypothetical protein
MVHFGFLASPRLWAYFWTGVGCVGVVLSLIFVNRLEKLATKFEALVERSGIKRGTMIPSARSPLAGTTRHHKRSLFGERERAILRTWASRFFSLKSFWRFIIAAIVLFMAWVKCWPWPYADWFFWSCAFMAVMAALTALGMFARACISGGKTLQQL